MPSADPDNELAAERRLRFLALSLVIGDRTALVSRTLARFPDPGEALRAPVSELLSLGFDHDRAGRLTSPRAMEDAHKEFDRLARKGYSLLTLGDAGYPALLREIFDPPCALACAGRPDVLREPAVAIVGSRKPTPYGRAVAGRLAEDLASRGIVIVSGLAEGIDGASHEGALKGGRTVAVLGSGLDVPYPPSNRKLFRRITEAGAVVSEFPLGTVPFAGNFPRRNRIISGLALALVVVEAAERSGSLITAQRALEQNREVCAVPGNVTSALSRGPNGLIKAGAKVVETWEDVVEELPDPVRNALRVLREGEAPPLPFLTDAEAAVRAALAPDAPAHVDELRERTGLPIPELLAVLLDLEIKGAAVEISGKRYLRRW